MCSGLIARLRTVEPAAYRTTTVGEVTTTDLPRVEGSTSAFDAFSEMLGDRSDVLLVERDGRVVGPVSRADFTDVLAIRGETVAF